MSDRTERAAMREVVAATLALDRAAKDFARELGYREALELVVGLVGRDSDVGCELRAELRAIGWRSYDAELPAGVGPVRDRRDGYALAAERMVRALRAVGLQDDYAAYAGEDATGSLGLPAGFRSFGAPVADMPGAVR